MTADADTRRVAILGLGVMGASIGLALRARTDWKVVGWDRNPRAAEIARDRAAVDQVAASVEEAARSAEVAILAAPLIALPDLAARLAPHLDAEATVTDIGSVKARIVALCEQSLGPRFVGGHPMAGKERNGGENADPDVLRGASWVLTPTAHTAPCALARAQDVVIATGARPVLMSPEEHDRMAAYLSHLPHAVAFALAGVVRGSLDDETIAHAGGGYRSATRVAGADPLVWASILMENADHVLEALRRFIPVMTRLHEAVERRNLEQLARILAEGHRP